MTSRRSSTIERPRLASLSKQEIDRRIEALLAHVASDPDESRVVEGARSALAPRWITPAELVRRMRPFLSRN